MIEHYPADFRKIRTIPCGVDPSEFARMNQAEARRQLGLPADGPIILQLGRMVPRKGVDNVIRALARLRSRRGIAARQVIVGGEAREPDPSLTPEIGRLRAIARDEGVDESVHFVGARDRHELRPFYGAADVFVSTPWYEPFGITPLEAMACGVPVVGSAVGGIQSTVVDNQTGFLVPPNDADALADRLGDVLGDASLRLEMGRRGIRRVNTRYKWESVARRSLASTKTRSPTIRPLPSTPLHRKARRCWRGRMCRDVGSKALDLARGGTQLE